MDRGHEWGCSAVGRCCWPCVSELTRRGPVCMARRGGALPTGSISWRTAEERRLAGGTSSSGGGSGGGGGGASGVLLDQDSSSERASRRGGSSAKGVHHGHGNSTSHNDHDNQGEGFRMWTADDEHKGRSHTVGGSGSGGGGGTIRTLCAGDKARVARLVAQLDQETEVSAGRGLCIGCRPAVVLCSHRHTRTRLFTEGGPCSHAYACLVCPICYRGVLTVVVHRHETIDHFVRLTHPCSMSNRPSDKQSLSSWNRGRVSTPSCLHYLSSSRRRLN